MSLRNPFSKLEKRWQRPGGSFRVLSNGTPVIPEMNKFQAFENSDLYSVIDLISSTVARADFISNSKQDLLNTPSELLNRYSFWQSVMINLLIDGNAYVQIVDNKHLRIIPSECVIVDLTHDVLTYEISGLDDLPNMNLKAKEILHFRLMNRPSPQTINNLIGVSPIDSLIDELEMQQLASKLAIRQLDTGMHPTDLVTMPFSGETSDEVKNKVRGDLKKAMSDNGILVMDETAKYQQLSVNADVTQFLNTVNLGRDKISEAFGIPESFLNGQGDQQSSMNMANERFMNAMARYIEAIVSELRFKLGDSSIRLNMHQASDYADTDLIKNVNDLVKNEVIGSDEAQALLIKKGVI